jgi:FkbM family methyltransferase
MGRSPTAGEQALSWVLRSLPLKHGAHRLLDWVCPSSWSNDPIVVCDFQGQTLSIDISDLVGWHFFMLRTFDPEVVEIVVGSADKTGEEVLWDIGANKGTCSYQLAHKLPNCKIVAIEPQEDLIPCLTFNLAQVAEGRAEIFAVGVGKKAETLDLHIPKGNRGGASLIHSYTREETSVSVTIETADAIRARSRYGWPTLVKIDVEGFEASVISSLAPAFTSRRIKCCVFECAESEREGFRQIRKSVQASGYKIFAIRKSVFSTWLEETIDLVKGASDYAIIR